METLVSSSTKQKYDKTCKRGDMKKPCLDGTTLCKIRDNNKVDYIAFEFQKQKETQFCEILEYVKPLKLRIQIKRDWIGKRDIRLTDYIFTIPKYKEVLETAKHLWIDNKKIQGLWINE